MPDTRTWSPKSVYPQRNEEKTLHVMFHDTSLHDIKRLRRLLSIPAGRVASRALLKVDPVWDPIRNRPDFHQLLSGPEQVGPGK